MKNNSMQRYYLSDQLREVLELLKVGSKKRSSKKVESRCPLQDGKLSQSTSRVHWSAIPKTKRKYGQQKEEQWPKSRREDHRPLRLGLHVRSARFHSPLGGLVSRSDLITAKLTDLCLNCGEK